MVCVPRGHVQIDVHSSSWQCWQFRNKCPRRTIKGTAAASIGAVLRHAAEAVPRSGPQAQSAATQCPAILSSDASELLEKLRSLRRAQRQRKKERRRLAKEAAKAPVVNAESSAGRVVSPGEEVASNDAAEHAPNAVAN